MQGNSGLIILVEDNPHDAEMFRKAIRKAEISTFLRVYNSGQEALDSLYQARSSSHPVSLIVLDLALPDITGTELCNSLLTSSLLSQPRISFLTSYPTPEAIKIVHNNPEIKIFIKPANLVDYTKLIWEIMDFACPATPLNKIA